MTAFVEFPTKEIATWYSTSYAKCQASSCFPTRPCIIPIEQKERKGKGGKASAIIHILLSSKHAHDTFCFSYRREYYCILLSSSFLFFWPCLLCCELRWSLTLSRKRLGGQAIG